MWIRSTEIARYVINDTGSIVAILPANSTNEEVDSAAQTWLASQPQSPKPNWEQFKLTALNDETLTAILLAVQSIRPQCNLLYVGLSKAESGDFEDFKLAWGAIVQSANVPAEVIAGFVQVAQSCHLPAEFVAALQPPNP